MPGLVLLETRQEARWPVVLWRALPQRATWRVEAAGSQLAVSSDFRLARWYCAVVAGLWVLLGVGLLAAAYTAGPSGPGMRWLNDPSGLWLAGLALALLPVILHLQAALGGRRVGRAWQQVLAAVEGRGGALQPVATRERHGVAITGLCVYLFALAAWIVAVALPPRHGQPGLGWMMGFLGVALVLVLLLLVAAGVLFASKAFGLRMNPLLPGLGTAMAMLFLLLIPMPWVATTLDAGPLRQGVGMWQAVLAGETPPPGWQKVNPELRSEIGRLYGWFQALARQAVAVTAVVVGIGLIFGVASVNLALRVRPELERLRAFRGRGVYRMAISGGVARRLLRGLFGTFWSVLAALLLAALAFAVLCGVEAVVPLFEHPRLQVPELSALMVAVALGRPVGDPWTEVTVRALWVLYGLGALALLAASVGQLALDRRRTRRALRRAVAVGEEAWPGLLECSPDLGQVRLVAAPDVPLKAEAHAFGLRQRERYVAVSPRLLAGLEPEERRALLAHELAHHRLGHCRLFALARWLGRLTFVGDGFVTALLDSAGLETEADDEARRRFGLPGPVLESCIRKVVEPVEPEPAPPYRPWRRLRAEHSAVGYTDPRLPRSTRWRHARRMFIRQFTGASSPAYWHPAAEDRLAALRASQFSR